MVDMMRPVPLDIEPKRNNRWVMEFPADLGLSEWVVQTSARPKIALNTTEVHFMNSSTFLPGRVTWEGITVTFIDPIGPSSSQKIMDWIRQHYESATGRMGYATQYKKNIVLKMLDPAGNPVEKWVLYGTYVEGGDFGDLDYSSDDLSTISLTLKFDRAILEY